MVDKPRIPLDFIVEDPRFWRAEAAQFRAVATTVRHPATRESLLALAAVLEQEAQKAERRAHEKYGSVSVLVCQFEKT